MIHFLKLIRIKNLLIVALTQYAMRFLVLEPALKLGNFELQFSNLNFSLLVLTTVLITAGGYVINDYFDTKTDLLNRPKTVIVGRHISRRTTMAMHSVFNVIAIILGFYISYNIGIYQLGFIFVLTTGLLWYYSTSYKRQFLIGNLIVAFMTAMVPLMVILFELPLLNKEYGSQVLSMNSNFNHLFFWVVGFSALAFLSTLIREIIKDMEDFEGDSAYGRNTIPIILGMTATKTIVLSLIIIMLCSLGFVFFKYLYCLEEQNGICIKFSLPTILYFSIALWLPILFLIFRFIRAQTQRQYHFVSNLVKIIMLSGIFYSIIVYYTFTYQIVN